MNSLEDLGGSFMSQSYKTIWEWKNMHICLKTSKMVRKFNMYPITRSCACVIYLHIKFFTHLKKSLTYLNFRIHTNKFCKKLCLSWIQKMFHMKIMDFSTIPPSYHISFIRLNAYAILPKIFHQWFQSFNNFFMLLW